MKMSEATILILGEIATISVMFALIATNPRAFKKGEPDVTTDTVVVVKTDTLVETHYIDRWKTKVQHDTVRLETVEHDTVSVPIPIEYMYEKYENATVLYHGYEAGIDSLIVYPKTEFKYITNTETVTKVKQPFIVFGPSVTAGVDMNGKANIVVGASATLNINSFKRKRK